MISSVVARLDRLDVPSLDRAGVERVLTDITVAQAWIDALRNRVIHHLDQLADINPAIFPEQIIAATTNTPVRAATRKRQVAATLAEAPAMAAALAAGECPPTMSTRCTPRPGCCRSRSGRGSLPIRIWPRSRCCRLRGFRSGGAPPGT